MAAKAAKTTTGKNRPTMGTSASAARNISGQPSKSTTPVAKKGGAGGMIDAATAAHRQGIEEHLGSQLRISATLYAPNASESSSTMRNVRLLKPAMGSSVPFASGTQG